MTTDSLWQRTQIGYLPRQTTRNTHETEHQFLQGMASTVVPSQLSSQLQFNMNVPMLPENMATHFRKPKPIVIEKLEGPKLDNPQPNFVPRIPENYPHTVNSSLSSERLAFAVNLAKRDIKRAKLMPSLEDQPLSDGQPKDRHSPRKRKTRREEKQPTETMRQRVQKSLRNHKEQQRTHDMYFFPASKHIPDNNENHQALEIRKLRKELHSYMRQLEDLQENRPMVLRNRDKRIKTRRENMRLSDDEVDERQLARSEEQAVRSSRMLYALQQQVRDLQDELNRKGRSIKHTKKSQTLHRLAAAHRAAVRALQTFISQTPLHSKASNGRPDMYQDLSILVRQLSLLSSQLQVGDNEQDTMDESLTNKCQPTRPSAFVKDVDETSFIKPNIQTPPTKDREHREPFGKKPLTPNPSPERDAVLRAGLQALVRAREEATNTEKIQPKVFVSSRPVALPVKKSVLLPAQLKAKRQHMQPTVPKLKPSDINQAGFAKDTVSSTLRRVEKDDAEDQPSKSPPRTPIKCPQRGTPIKRHGSPERLCDEMKVSPKSHQVSPRPHRRSLENEFKNPRSAKYQRQMLPVEKEILERELARQVWLDREADLRMQELEDELNRKRHQEFTSQGVRLARQMIHETEEAILDRLQPILDRAEAIMETNKKNEQEKKRSLQHQLTDLTTRSTLEQAHVLADDILEDMLDDTVLELQRLEMEDEAEREVTGAQNRSTLENVMQRLQSFEKGENDIRRHWTRITYDDVDRASHTVTTKETTHQAKPITFTKKRPENHENYLDRKVKQLSKRARLLEDRKRFRHEPDDTESESGSTASLLEGISTARSSDVASHHKPSSTLRRPHLDNRQTITLFVPSELRTSIASYRSKYERFLRDTVTHEQGSFNPWTLAERISEDLLDELIIDIAAELGGVCDEYTENIFTKEFIPAADTSTVSLKL